MLQVGFVGSGFAARLRAQALVADGRARLAAVASRTQASAEAFVQAYGGDTMALQSRSLTLATWQDLVERADIDLVVVAHANYAHGAVVKAALEAGKPVVVEYPLCLDPLEGHALLDLARSRGLLLHVEHIERLGGTHQAALQHLAAVGQLRYGRYCTVTPKTPAPDKWTYEPEMFGFPLMGALSRVQRLVHLFGPVAAVSSQCWYDGVAAAEFSARRYRSCLCLAQLQFVSGAVAEISYGKGEGFWQPCRQMEVQGSEGSLHFDGDSGERISAEGAVALPVAGRRGLFAQDMGQVLDHLLEQTPLYIDAGESLYALEVADALRQAAEMGQTVAVASAWPST